MSAKMSQQSKSLIVSNVCNPLLASNHSLGVRQSSHTGKPCSCLLCVCARGQIDMPAGSEKAKAMARHR
eukprot:757269-Hanusia_phi.AAC.3